MLHILALVCHAVGDCKALDLDLISTPQSLVLVTISIHSGLDHDLVSVEVI